MDGKQDKEKLQEKDFIHEEYRKHPFPFWFWLFVVAAAVGLIWMISVWYYSTLESEVEKNPFLRVTNRQFSIFLWQNPEFMRVNVSNKTGYLPGFQYAEKVTMDLGQADDYVVAPPEVIFRYHVWNRLLGDVYFPRSITKEEFLQFLNYAEEWQPSEWPLAPEKYKHLVQTYHGNLEHELPLIVRQAFQGWKNFFKEGEAINALQIRHDEMELFLRKHPHYARSYWRNIVAGKTPNYLVMEGRGEEVISVDEIAPFLRVAFYNYLQSQRGL